jgi:hypothetical protein
MDQTQTATAEAGTVAVNTLPVTLVVSAAVALGLWIGVLYLKRSRRPYLIGIHLLLGLGGMEQMVVLHQGTPAGEALRAGSYGTMALGLFALAMFTGLAAPLFWKQAPRAAEAVLATHATVGFAGFILFLAWLSTT